MEGDLPFSTGISEVVLTDSLEICSLLEESHSWLRESLPYVFWDRQVTREEYQNGLWIML